MTLVELDTETVAEFFRGVRSSLWEDLLASIPDEWEVSGDTRQAMDQFLLGRARLSDNFRKLLIREMPQGILDFDSLGEGAP